MIGVVYHIPHNSSIIPPEIEDYFIANIKEEINKATDFFTLELFINKVTNLVLAPYSLVVVNVQRNIYQAIRETALRRKLSSDERDHLIKAYYEPHHRLFNETVSKVLEKNDHCLILDCHSFEPRISERMDICIGTSRSYTPNKIRDEFVSSFQSMGFNVEINNPYTSPIVPKEYFDSPRVWSIMK
jgi:N-formylglutamate amidohydrolase